MSKIEELEKKMMKNGMTEDDFVRFKSLLRYVRSDFLKNQHCYTTAVQFPKENAQQAIKLIQYGLDAFGDDYWSSRLRAYLNMGIIYCRTGDYKNAYQSFINAQKQETTGETYHIQISVYLLWAKMHIDKFQYSDKLEEYYNLYQKSDEFAKSFLNNRFRVAVSKIVIALHHGKKEEAKSAYQEALEIMNPGYKGKLFDILKRHKYTESLELTPEVIEYMGEIKSCLE